MSYIILIYLLLSAGIGTTTQQQARYEASYTQTGTVSDACKVKSSPYFPVDFSDQCRTTPREQLQWGHQKRQQF